MRAELCIPTLSSCPSGSLDLNHPTRALRLHTFPCRLTRSSSSHTISRLPTATSRSVYSKATSARPPNPVLLSLSNPVLLTLSNPNQLIPVNSHSFSPLASARVRVPCGSILSASHLPLLPQGDRAYACCRSHRRRTSALAAQGCSRSPRDATSRRCRLQPASSHAPSEVQERSEAGLPQPLVLWPKR